MYSDLFCENVVILVIGIKICRNFIIFMIENVSWHILPVGENPVFDYQLGFKTENSMNWQLEFVIEKAKQELCFWYFSGLSFNTMQNTFNPQQSWNEHDVE